MASQHKIIRHKLIGYYAIPHELLQVLAYRLIGKPYHYEWGSQYVRALALEAETRREKLFVLLFPLIVSWGLGFLCHLLWIISAFFIFYGGTAHLDLILAYRILFGQEQVQVMK